MHPDHGRSGIGSRSAALELPDQASPGSRPVHQHHFPRELTLGHTTDVAGVGGPVLEFACGPVFVGAGLAAADHTAGEAEEPLHDLVAGALWMLDHDHIVAVE